MDLSVFLEWRSSDVVKRTTEDAAFEILEKQALGRKSHLSRLERELMALERQCLATKPHFDTEQARLAWITSTHNKRYGYGLWSRQTKDILAMCSRYYRRISIIEGN